MKINLTAWAGAFALLVAAASGDVAAQDRDRDGYRDRDSRDYRDDRNRRGGEKRDYYGDRDDNPPGPRGGPGTNWENPPGWRGGRGASPDYRYWRHDNRRYRFASVRGGYYFHPRFGYYHPSYGWWNQSARCWRDRDDNPPGPRGGPGTNWENPPGWRGGPGASPDRFGDCR